MENKLENVICSILDVIFLWLEKFCRIIKCYFGSWVKRLTQRGHLSSFRVPFKRSKNKSSEQTNDCDLRFVQITVATQITCPVFRSFWSKEGLIRPFKSWTFFHMSSIRIILNEPYSADFSWSHSTDHSKFKFWAFLYMFSIQITFWSKSHLTDHSKSGHSFACHSESVHYSDGTSQIKY